MYDLRSQRILDFKGHPVEELTTRQLELALTLVMLWAELKLLPLRVEPIGPFNADAEKFQQSNEQLWIWCPQGLDAHVLRAALEEAGWERADVAHAGSVVRVHL